MSCAARAAAADQIAYNSCRNRHCPKCQAGAARRWLEARQADLLPVEYYHVVFTLPAPIADIAYQNKAVIYGLLFDVAAETLLHHRRRPEAPGRPHRRDAGAAHLGLGADAPPARARHRSRRRAVAGRQALGRLQARLLPVGARAVAAVPAALPRRARSRLHRAGQLQFFGEHAALADAAGLRRLARAAAPVRVGRLRQAPVRRTRGGAGLSVALHAPGRDLQQPARRHGRARRHLPLEGLPRQGQDAPQDDDARRRRVHAPLPAARACPAASIASATTGCSPTAAARPTWRACASCSTQCPRPHRKPRTATPRSSTPSRASSACTAAPRCSSFRPSRAGRRSARRPDSHTHHECNRLSRSNHPPALHRPEPARHDFALRGIPVVRCSRYRQPARRGRGDARRYTLRRRSMRKADRRRHRKRDRPIRHSAVAPSDHRGTCRGFLP